MSHNALSESQNNGKTLAAFFRGWDRDALAQLYFAPETPDRNVCGRFYRVTDLDMLRRALGLSSRAGVLDDPADGSAEAADEAVQLERARLHRNVMYRFVRDIFQRRMPWALLLRSAFWRERWWYTDQLESWLDSAAPEVVFFQSSNSTFAFDVVETICERRRIPMVMETTDDYVTWNGAPGPAKMVYHRAIVSAYRRAVGRAHAVIAIGGQMAEEYEKRFGGRFEVAMNAIPPRTQEVSLEMTSGEPLLVYAGNLGLNRWRVLVSIAHALRRLEEATGRRVWLEVYSLTQPTSQMLRAFGESGHVRFGGAKDSAFLESRLAQATLLVHVESFDRRNRRVTRLSVSTKIPEYFAADRAILAVGPADVASITYLSQHDAAFVACKPNATEIAEVILAALTDDRERERRRLNGKRLLQTYHSDEGTRRLIRGLVEGALTAKTP